MAIRAVLARRSRYDRETIVLETIILPIKLPAHMAAPGAALPPLPANAVGYACRNNVSPKPILFKTLYRMNYEMLTFRRTHGYIVYQSDYRAVIHIELSHTCSLARQEGFEPSRDFHRLAVQQTALFNHLSTTAYLVGASVRWKHLYLRSCTEVPPTTGYVIFLCHSCTRCLSHQIVPIWST